MQQRGFQPIEDEDEVAAAAQADRWQRLLPRLPPSTASTAHPPPAGKALVRSAALPWHLSVPAAMSYFPDSAFYRDVTQRQPRRSNAEVSAVSVIGPSHGLSDTKILKPTATRSREYARILSAERAAGTRPTAYSTMTPAQIQRQRVSTIRSRARKAGQLIPLQQVGRADKYGPLKPVCRIRTGCPLGEVLPVKTSSLD